MNKIGQLYDMFVPSFDELRSNICKGLQSSFEIVNCEIVDCPDLTASPFFLSGKGICGSPTIADIGGFSNLLPMPNLDQKFDFGDVVLDSKIPDAFLCGAGAGPFYEVHVNCEIVADAKFENFKIQNNQSVVAKVDNEKNNSFPAVSSKFALLGQFLCCEGKSGKVLKIRAEKRKKDDSMMSVIQHILAQNYGSQSLPVGLGGVILVESGSVKIHVMPPFSETPLDSPAKVTEWLKFFTVPAPFVAVGEMVSHDPLKLDLRLEHFHGFTSDRSQAGHFHYDVTPDIVKYTAYFVIGEKLLRQHKPIGK